jgi:predicted phage terminase large subunit-like protein
MTKYIPHIPTAKQTAFLLLDCKEAFYGGAAGGGKSDALLMAALQYVDIPGYSAILFRKTYADLTLPGALMDRAKEWLAPFPEVRWNEKDKTYHFPSGATLTFGYLEHDNDKYRYQSAEFQFIGFDELTQLQEGAYRYMFSRLRRLRGATVPLRVRSASNPGNDGHEWVKKRFVIEGPSKGRIFIPAKLEDNPYLDMEAYEESLAELDIITRMQLREGNWDVKHDGSIFQRQWFEIVDQAPPCRKVRFWDLAATEVKKGRDPDWTAGLLLGERKGIYYICHVVRVRKTPKDVEELVKQCAKIDGYGVNIYMEQEPGSSGVNTIDHYARNVLKGYAFWGVKSTGSKALRAAPVSSAAEQGRIKIVRGPWITDFLDELEAFPNGKHDDQVDVLSGAFQQLRTINTSAIPLEVGDGESYWCDAG